MFSTSLFNDPWLTQDPFTELIDPFSTGFARPSRMMNRFPQQLSLENQPSTTTSLTPSTGRTGRGGLLGSLTNAEDQGWLSFSSLVNEPVNFEIHEKDNEYEIIARRPQGLRKKDLHVEVSGNVLTVSGQRERHRRQRKGETRDEFVSFSRSITLPESVNLDKICAKYDDQQNLKIELPKVSGKGPRLIQIGGAQPSQAEHGKSDASQGQIKDQEKTDMSGAGVTGGMSGDLGSKTQQLPMEMEKEAKTGQEPRASHQVPITG